MRDADEGYGEYQSDMADIANQQRAEIERLRDILNRTYAERDNARDLAAVLECTLRDMAHGVVSIGEAVTYLKMNGTLDREHPMTEAITDGLRQANLAFRNLYNLPAVSHKIIDQTTIMPLPFEDLPAPTNPDAPADLSMRGGIEQVSAATLCPDCGAEMIPSTVDMSTEQKFQYWVCAEHGARAFPYAGH